MTRPLNLPPLLPSRPYGDRPRGSRPPPRNRGETNMDRMREGRGNGGLVMNENITAAELRLLDEDKEPLGVFPTVQALQMAQEQAKDLILIAPDASPPVARLVELSRFKFEQEKAAKEARKKQKAGQQELKEIRLRPNTDVHDYQVNLSKAVNPIFCRGSQRHFSNLSAPLCTKFSSTVYKATETQVSSVDMKPKSNKHD